MTHLIPCGKSLAPFTLTISLLVSLTGNAQTQPEAGQILRELQQPILNAPQIAPKSVIEEPAQEQRRSGNTRFMLKAINISGNSEIPTDVLQALLADLVGEERSLAELTDAATRITAYYRAHGYAVARAYLPAQEVKNGTVAINVVEGRIARQRIDNQSLLSEERVNAFLNHIHEGDVIKSAQIDRSLLLLNDTPGVGSARATLQPGAAAGTSDLLMELKPSAQYSGNISLDNYGNRYTGQYQLGGTFNINSPLRIGDQVTLKALVSDQHLSYGRAAYQLPVRNDGLRLGAAYTDMRYRLGKEFDTLTGKAANSTLFIAYPFIRSQQSNLTGMFIWEQIALTDTVSGRRIQLANMNISGDCRDALGGGGISTFDLSFKLGRLNIGSPDALAIDNGSARTNGAYTRLTYAANRSQHLAKFNQLSFSISGQQANKNLDSAEKFSLGGAKGVRAYPQGEGVGDQGYLVTLELSHYFTGTVQGSVFYDTGSITVNRNPYGATASNSRNLSGAGIGFNAHLAGIQFKAALAWRIGGGEPTSIPSTAATRAILWAQVTRPF